MAFLQRPPIDVSTAIGCRGREATLYETTARLLKASISLRPYCGAIIRSAMTNTELAACLDRDPVIQDVALAHPSFLDPVNRAMQDWWSTRPQHEDYDVKDLKNAVMVTSSLPPHVDQTRRDNGEPAIGPLTAVATLRGTSAYLLSIWKRDAFNPDDMDDIAELALEKEFEHGVEPLLAGHRDLVLFTNLPPVIHSVETSPGRMAVRYHSHLAKKELAQA